MKKKVNLQTTYISKKEFLNLVLGTEGLTSGRYEALMFIFDTDDILHVYEEMQKPSSQVTQLIKEEDKEFNTLLIESISKGVKTNFAKEAGIENSQFANKEESTFFNSIIQTFIDNFNKITDADVMKKHFTRISKIYGE